MTYQLIQLTHRFAVILFIQFFEISGTLYALVMSIETIVMLNMVQGNRRVQNDYTIYRHIVYHVVVGGFGASTTIWLNVTESFELGGSWCWISINNYALYLGYIPIWISILGIAICDIIIIQTIFKSSLLSKRGTKPSQNARGPTHRVADGAGNGVLLGPESVSSSSENPEESALSKNSKFRGVFIRMVLYPLLLILLFLPGSVMRIHQVGGFGEGNYLYVFRVAQWICDPAKGTLNAIMWVLTDSDVRKELYVNFMRLSCIQPLLKISTIESFRNLTDPFNSRRAGQSKNHDASPAAGNSSELNEIKTAKPPSTYPPSGSGSNRYVASTVIPDGHRVFSLETEFDPEHIDVN